MPDQVVKKTPLYPAGFEHHYDSLIGTLPGVVYTLDEKGTFTFVSDGARSVLGFTREDLVGKHFSTIIHPGDLPSVSREYLLPRFEGVPTGSDRAPKLFDERRAYPRRTSGLQVRLQRSAALKDQPEEVVRCKVNASGQYNEANQFCGTVGVIYDAVEEEEQAFSFESTRKYNAFELLTHALSHVFSNVFTGIYGNLQLIEMQLEHPERFSDNISAIKHSIENAVSLVKKLSGTISAQTTREICNVGRILTDEAEGLLSTSGLAYRCTSSADLWRPQLDPDYARHIVRAVYFHIARAMQPQSVVEVSACNVLEAAVKLPRIDCTYIQLSFSYSEAVAQAERTEEGFTELERIASMVLSYELLKKVGGHVEATRTDTASRVDLYLPAQLTASQAG